MQHPSIKLIPDLDNVQWELITNYILISANSAGINSLYEKKLTGSSSLFKNHDTGI